jgi:hypothetical protein
MLNSLAIVVPGGRQPCVRLDAGYDHFTKTMDETRRMEKLRRKKRKTMKAQRTVKKKTTTMDAQRLSKKKRKTIDA